MTNMNIPSLDPSNFKPGERVFDPKHPEKSTIGVSICADSRQSGSIHLAQVIAEALLNAGYSNVHIDGVEMSYENLNTCQFGVDPTLKDTQKKVKIDMAVLTPKSLPGI
jgi:hypothetical protein